MITPRLRSKIRRAKKQIQSSQLIEAEQIAVTNDDGVSSVRVTDGDTPNMIWCKLYGSDERIVQAYNTRVQVREKLPVWLRALADGTFEVEGLRARDGTEFLGEGAPTMNSPEVIGALLGTNWPPRNLDIGRASLSDAGGMILTIGGFYYSGGKYNGGTIDLTAYIPSTSGKQVWAVIYYDPSAAALGVTTGTEHDLPYTMTEVELGAIALSPQFISLAGVLLTNGDTTLSASSIIIARQAFIDAPINSEAFFPIEITDTRTIPANRQLAIRRLAVTGSGILNVYGVLDVF